MLSLRRAGSVGSAAVAAAIAVVACYAPTEVRLEISTDRPCVAPQALGDPDPNALAKGGRTWVEIGPRVAETTVQAETESCVPSASGGGDIGSLVLVPSGDRDDRAMVQVTMTVDGSDPGACKVDARGALPAQCIVTRRSFAFIAHTSRTIPIKLYDACRGVLCAEDQGCGEGGACQFADIDRRCEGCDAGASPPDGAGAADVAAPDVVAPDTGALDAAPDAPLPNPGCTGTTGLPAHVLVENGEPAADILVGNTTTLFWSTMGSEGIELHAVPKAGGPVVNLPRRNWSVIAALAADDETLWIAIAAGLVTSYDIKTGLLDPVDHVLSGVRSVAIKPSADSSLGSTAYFAVGSAEGDTLYRATPKATPTVVPGARGGERLVLGGPYAFAFNSLSNMTEIERFGLGDSSLSTIFISTSARAVGAAWSAGSLFVAAPDLAGAVTGTLNRLDDGSFVSSPLYAVDRPGQLAADDTYLYYVDQGPLNGVTNAASVRRGSRTAGAAGAALMPFVSLARGLAIDSAPFARGGCVYLWAQKDPAAVTGSLLVYPKTGP